MLSIFDNDNVYQNHYTNLTLSFRIEDETH